MNERRTAAREPGTTQQTAVMVERSKQGRRAVTIYDVAAAAGVSHQTVANVIKAPHRVAPATREKVAHHIDALGFRPNRMAQNLSRQRSNLIAFRVGRRNPLASVGILDTFLHSMAEAAEQFDHHIVLFHSDVGVAEVEKAVSLEQSKSADVFVIAGTHAGDPRIPAYLEAKLRFVTFGRTDVPDAHSWVDTDNVRGTALATEHLLELGHRRIGFLGWPGPSTVGTARESGWRETLQRARRRHAATLVARAENQSAEAVPVVKQLLERQPDLTALVAASDELAVGAQIAAGELGRTLSVTGYDDGPLATVGDGLTTIRQPIPAIAAEIVRIAVTLADSDGDGGPPVHLDIAPELVVRGSTAPPDP